MKWLCKIRHKWQQHINLERACLRCGLQQYKGKCKEAWRDKVDRPDYGRCGCKHHHHCNKVDIIS